MKPQKKFYQLTLINLTLLIFVICFGAYVRMTGSGAGCGSHWPLCNGVIIPKAPALKTIIEFSHRLTSGLLLILSLVLCYKSIKRYPSKHLIRRLCFAYLFFLIIEAFIGASLVLLKHVALNQSIYRGFSVSLHLINVWIIT